MLHEVLANKFSGPTYIICIDVPMAKASHIQNAKQMEKVALQCVNIKKNTSQFSHSLVHRS